MISYSVLSAKRNFMLAITPERHELVAFIASLCARSIMLVHFFELLTHCGSKSRMLWYRHFESRKFSRYTCIVHRRYPVMGSCAGRTRCAGLIGRSNLMWCKRTIWTRWKTSQTSLLTVSDVYKRWLINAIEKQEAVLQQKFLAQIRWHTLCNTNATSKIKLLNFPC